MRDPERLSFAGWSAWRTTGEEADTGSEAPGPYTSPAKAAMTAAR